MDADDQGFRPPLDEAPTRARKCRARAKAPKSWPTRLAVPALLALAGCAPLPQRAGIPTQWWPSPNYDTRRPNFVVLHHTGAHDAGHSLATLADPDSAVSAHYLVARDGTVWQLVDERARAWHAGDSYWGGATDLNSASIGIELDNGGDEPFPDAQIDALVSLLADVMDRYRIPRANVLGHGDIAPARKVDPSRYFPWGRLAMRGFGRWCKSEAAATATQPSAPASSPSPLPRAQWSEALLLLQAIGYDVADPAATIGAFRRHFRQDDTAELTLDDLSLLRCLAAQKPAQRATRPPSGLSTGALER